METLSATDGVLLRLHDWPRPAARGRVLLVHGLGEHVERYHGLSQALQAAGWAVTGYDQRGHGRSGGARGVIPDADALCRDLGDVVDVARRRSTGPLVLLGHSMGGAVAARFVAEALSPKPATWSRRVDALVLSSPALALPLSPGQKLLLGLLPRVLPELSLSNGLQPEWISRDAEVVRAYRADRLVHDRVSPALVRFMVDAGALARSLAARWTTPTLLMWGEEDRCVDPRGSQAFAAAAPAEIVQQRAWPSLAHEVFNEPEREQVVQRLLEFLRELAPSPSAASPQRSRR